MSVTFQRAGLHQIKWKTKRLLGDFLPDSMDNPSWPKPDSMVAGMHSPLQSLRPEAGTFARDRPTDPSLLVMVRCRSLLSGGRAFEYRQRPLQPPGARPHGRLTTDSAAKAAESTWRGGRVVDGSGLENRRGESLRGFESRPLRFDRIRRDPRKS